MKRLLLAALIPGLLAACTTTTPAADAMAGTDAPVAAATSGAASTASSVDSAGLDAAVAGSWRDSKNTPRDVYRHPRETLAFFGVGKDE
ncbi:MAG TPA: hypothetical protein VFR30_06085, partial [Lysobacter sp.]|nr:hypothetical protein [Lysobacter sp.]